MGRRTQKLKLWITGHVPVPLLLIGGAVVVILCFNEDVSPSRSYTYLQEIVELKKEIRTNLDSAEYYRRKSKDLTASPDELEHIAREQYMMQKADEEVFILK